MSEDDARSSPFRNLLTRALGSTPNVEVDVFSGLQLEKGDAVILVSDGVTGYLDEDDFTAVLHKAATAQEAAQRMVDQAVQRGGADNATAVVVLTIGLFVALGRIYAIVLLPLGLSMWGILVRPAQRRRLRAKLDALPEWKIKPE